MCAFVSTAAAAAATTVAAVAAAATAAAVHLAVSCAAAAAAAGVAWRGKWVTGGLAACQAVTGSNDAAVQNRLGPRWSPAQSARESTPARQRSRAPAGKR